MNMVETRSSRRRPRESDDQEAGDPDLVSRGYSTEESHREHERYPLSPGTTQREIQEYLIPRARKSQRLHAGGRTGEAGERMIIDNEIEEVSVTGRGPQTGGKREMREEVGRTKRQLEVDSSGRGSGVGHRGARRELKSSMSGRRRDGKQLVISTENLVNVNNGLQQRGEPKGERSDGEHKASPPEEMKLVEEIDQTPALTGYLLQFPKEVLEQILGYLNPKELGVLATTCKYFWMGGMIEQVAQHHLKGITRAKGLKPRKTEREDGKMMEESQVMLLNFVQGQSKAAAQGTGIAMGSYHTIALLTSTEKSHLPDKAEYAMYSFGRGFHGQLGQGNYDSIEEPRPVETVEKKQPVRLYQGKPGDINLAVVNAGSSHSIAISRRGEMYTWGLASSGELGQGGWTPIEIPIPRMIMSLGRTRIVSVCAGANHSMAISESGQLWSCGRGRHGQLGHGHFHDEGVLTLVTNIQKERIVSASAGKAHSMALAADGKIFTWGDARHGQLGHSQLAPLIRGQNPQPIAIPFPQPISSLDPSKLKAPQRVTAISAGGNHSLAVTVGGTVLAFGCNSHGQLGLNDTKPRAEPTVVPLNDGEGGPFCRALQVQGGSAHSVILVQSLGRLEVRTAGDNSYGQLGHGDTNDRHTFERVKTLVGKGIICVSSGDSHSGAIAEDGSLYTWGRGDCGQLGHGDDMNRWTPKLVNEYRVIHPDRTLRRNRKVQKKAVVLNGCDRDSMRKDAEQLCTKPQFSRTNSASSHGTSSSTS